MSEFVYRGPSHSAAYTRSKLRIMIQYFCRQTSSTGGIFIKTTIRLRIHINFCRRMNNIPLNVLRLHAFETSVTICHVARCNIPEDSDLQRYPCANLKCCRSIQSLPEYVERDTATEHPTHFPPSVGCSTFLIHC